jgi:hypothetical protein
MVGGGAEALRGMSGPERAGLLVERFRKELGYASVKAWPIMGGEGGGVLVMYFMIHATDHPVAPGLMARAYNKAVITLDTSVQLTMEELLQKLPLPPENWSSLSWRIPRLVRRERPRRSPSRPPD